MPRTGRPPSAWTPDVEATILKAIAAGCYIETASALAGISKKTLYRRLKAGAQANSGPDYDFTAAVEKALAQGEFRDVAAINTAVMGGEWKAAAWRLERKFPERWGRRDKVTILKQLAEEVEQLSDDELLALVASGRSTQDETR